MRTTSMPKAKKIASKICVKCGKVLPINAFYPNKQWAEQSFHDAWCKTCAVHHCVNRDMLKEYCHYNNRMYMANAYDAAKKKAMYQLATHAEYLRAQGDEKKMSIIEEQTATRQYFSVMNLPNYYGYVNNIDDKDGIFMPPKEDDAVATDNAEIEDALIFSREWNGRFTQREIDYLDEYFQQLEDDFDLSSENMRDYGRKASKASLHADQTLDKVRRGEASISEWREAQAIFDTLSKSANFAACRRKPGEQAGLGALGLIIQKIEGMGILQSTKVTFPTDDVDRIIEDFRHTIAAVGLDVANGL